MIIVASENHNVASFSRFERTDFVGHPEGCGAVECERGDCFLNAHAHLYAGKRDCKGY